IVITKINDSIAKSKVEQRKAIDHEYQVFNQVIMAKNVAKEYNIVNDLKKEVRNANQNYFNARRLHYKAYSRLDNDYVILYKALIFITTIIVMFLLRNNFISLTIYLTIISYVTEGLTYSSSCYSLLTDFKNSYVSASRVKIILDFDDRKTLELGEINKSDLLGEIDFVRVNYKSMLDEFKITDLKDVSFHISTKQSVVFKGTRSCGKRTIFYMLIRMVKPDSGSCYLDKIKITDYSEKGYEGNINFIQTKPYFYNDTIIKNLKMVSKNERKIIEACKELEIYDYIMSLPNKFNTNINTLSQRDLYLIGLVRMLLFDSEVMIVYEFPNYLSQKDMKTVKKVFNQLSMVKTIIYFTATDLCDDLADKIYEVKNGEVKMVKVDPHRKAKTLFDTTK
ncbi:MAG: ABC transporter ATP-binding protein, partial [Clostridia bacterium]|nr:ABC transporter ATP-binding protein [Clostridia bacterium]